MIISNIMDLFTTLTAEWHKNKQEFWDWAEMCPVGNYKPQFVHWATKLHYHNYQVWHYEDYCRSGKADLIVWAKPNIDKHNQARCNSFEQLDDLARANLQISTTAPMHSETLGMMIDRYSINELKIWHTRELGEKFTARLNSLLQQGDHLYHCILAYEADLTTGSKSIMNFKQLKMYNDPATNPKFKSDDQ